MTPARTSCRQTGADESDDPGSAPKTLVEVADRSGCSPSPDLEWIEARLRAAVAMIERPVDRVGVAIVNDRQMTNLHRDHCGIDSTTDVLTFALSGEGEPVDADLSVCVDEAARQADSRGHSIEQELLLYCLHGVLHCAGFDDHTEDDYVRMHTAEDQILDRIGVGVTFRGPDRS